MMEMNNLLAQIDRIRSHKGVVSDNGLSVVTIQECEKEKRLQWKSNSDSLIISRNDNGVERLHFFSKSFHTIPSMKELIEELPSSLFVVDCIGMEAYVNTVCNSLCKAGFSRYTTLSRWKGQNLSMCSSSFPEKFEIYIAAQKDSGKVQNLLENNFDPLVSHLPSEDELMELINRGWVFCVHKGGDLCAAACMKMLGEKTAYLYQYVVSPEIRGLGVGSAIFQFAMNQFKNCVFFTSWTEDNNFASNRIHEKFGMHRDGLKDCVLIYDKH